MEPAVHGATSTRFEPRLGRSVSLDQAADLLAVSRRTIYNWIREGRLQTIRTRGGSQRVLVESVEDRSRQLRGQAVMCAARQAPSPFVSN